MPTCAVVFVIYHLVFSKLPRSVGLCMTLIWGYPQSLLFQICFCPFSFLRIPTKCMLHILQLSYSPWIFCYVFKNHFSVFHCGKFFIFSKLEIISSAMSCLLMRCSSFLLQCLSLIFPFKSFLEFPPLTYIICFCMLSSFSIKVFRMLITGF